MAAWGAEIRIEEGSYLIPRGNALFDDNTATWYLHPGDFILQVHKGRLPWETKYCLGVRELERDRRLHA